MVIAMLEDVTGQKQAQAALQLAYQTLERRVEERTHELATLNAIAATLSRSLDLKQVMSDALDKTCEIMDMEFGAAYRLEGFGEGQNSFLNPLAYRGVSEEFRRRASVLLLSGSAVELATTNEEPYVWEVETFPSHLEMKAPLMSEGIRQVVAVPLMAKDRLVGVLYLATGNVRLIAPEQLSLLSAIGQQIGVGVENARLYEAEQARRAEAERRRQVAEGLRGILAVLNSNRSLAEILDYIVEQSARLLGADAGFVFNLDFCD